MFQIIQGHNIALNRSSCSWMFINKVQGMKKIEYNSVTIAAPVAPLSLGTPYSCTFCRLWSFLSRDGKSKRSCIIHTVFFGVISFTMRKWRALTFYVYELQNNFYPTKWMLLTVIAAILVFHFRDVFNRNSNEWQSAYGYIIVLYMLNHIHTISMV